jgi:oxalate decarboxylase
VVSQNLNIPEPQLSVLPEQGLYIFPGKVPGSLEDDRKAVGGAAVASKIDYTFRMKAMNPTVDKPGGTARIVDSKIFPASTAIAGALFTMKPGALRELHWHPNASEWQYYISGSGRMTVFASEGQARTMDYKPNDVGYVPQVAGHYVENTGNDDLVFLALFKSSYFAEASLDQWLRRLPVQILQSHLSLTPTQIAMIPNTNNNIFRRK